MPGDGRGHENRPDPVRISTKREFGQELTLQRDRAGLSVRETARALGLPTSTVSDYFRGESLPRGPLLRKILLVCGVKDEADVERWLDARNRARQAPGRRPADAPIPYRGLESYQPEDADWFFGRERLTGVLIDHLRLRARDGGLLAVVGASGSGKSSLLRAGLIPELQFGGLGVPGSHIWPVTLMTPGAHPVRELAAQLAALTDDDPDRLESVLLNDPAQCAGLAGRAAAGEEGGDGAGSGGDDGEGLLILVVDQFEEVFTACRDDHERLAFIGALCAAAGCDAAGVRSAGLRPAALVVLGLRADFYPHVLGYPALVAALQSSQVVVGPMTEAELRSAIIGPARKAALDIEDGFIDLLLRDLAPSVGRALPGAAHDPGALPMLSFALLATWARSRGGILTVASYRDSGGIRGAVAAAADKVYNEQLDTAQQALARQIFIRLVHVADDTADTRRRVPRSELMLGRRDVLPVLDAFIAERLITAESSDVEIAHEALLLAWPRLREWVNSDRAGVRIQRQLTAAAEIWQESGRDPSAVYAGGRLAAVEEWGARAEHTDDLNRLEREFLDASTERKRVDERTARLRTRRMQGFASVLAVLSLVVGTLAVVAYRQKVAATHQRNLAVSRQVATEADQLRSTDIALSRQLSLASYRIAPTAEARSSLLNATATVAATRMLGTVGTEMHSVAFNPDKTILAAGNADGTVRMWDVRRQGRPIALGTPMVMPSGAVTSVAFSLEGTTLAAGTLGGAISLWNVREPGRPVLLDRISLPSGSAVNSIAWRPGGLTWAAASTDGRLYVWDASSPGHVSPVGAGVGPVNSVSFSGAGDKVAAGGAGGHVRVWRLASSGRPSGAGTELSGPAKSVNTLTFSPNGRMVAAGADDDEVWLWDIAGRRPAMRLPPLRGAASWIYSVAFSPDGHTLAAGSADNSAYVWKLTGGAPLVRLPHPAPVLSVAYGRDGDTLATGDADGIARIWSLPGPVLTGPERTVFTVVFSPDSGNLAVASGDGTVRLWAVSGINQAQPLSPPLAATQALDGTVAYGPGGRLAAGGADGSVQLWNVRDARHPVRLAAPPTALNTPIQYVIFDATGHLMAASSSAGSVELWDVTDFARPRALAVIPADAPGPGHTTWALAFSADRRLLAAAGGDGLVRLWDISHPSHPRQRGRPLTRLSSAVFQVTFGPRGRLLAASGEDGRVRLWDVAEARHPRLLTTLSPSAGIIYDVSFSPDGRTLASANTNTTVSLWNITDPSEPASLGSLTGPAGTVFSVAISPTANVLAAGSQDATTRLWLDSPAAAAHTICSLAGSPITMAEWERYIPGLPYDPPCAA
jgi:WD40 repeat protein/transcriptional regulator with XRE-family HTH domain